jgi:Universal stress protein family
MDGTRRIFARISGSPGSVPALRHAASLARKHDAPLIVLHAWLPPDSRRLPWPELRQLWEDDAWQRLWDTLDRAFGGLPAGITTQPVVLRGKARQGTGQPGLPARRPAGHRRRPTGPATATAGLRRQPLLPGPRLLPGTGHPAPALAQQAVLDCPGPYPFGGVTLMPDSHR